MKYTVNIKDTITKTKEVNIFAVVSMTHHIFSFHIYCRKSEEKTLNNNERLKNERLNNETQIETYDIIPPSVSVMNHEFHIKSLLCFQR